MISAAIRYICRLKSKKNEAVILVPADSFNGIQLLINAACRATLV